MGKKGIVSGTGDLNFFATYTLTDPGAKTLIGLGPQVVIPTASNEFTGAGKWQLGGAFVLFNAASPFSLWNFNTSNGGYNVPIGIGAGHVVKAGATVFNLLVEPQFTMLHNGTGQPAVQLFGGINCQF
jgi:hypothetical protein